MAIIILLSLFSVSQRYDYKIAEKRFDATRGQKSCQTKSICLLPGKSLDAQIAPSFFTNRIFQGNI